MKTLITLLTVLLLFTLAACAPRSAATPTETLPTLLPQPSATPAPLPTATVDPSLVCLQGDWVLSGTTTEALLAYISSIPSMKILEGALRLRFDDGAFAYHSDDLFLRTSFMEGFLDARARVLIEGTYTTDGATIQFTKTGAQNELYDWRAVDSQGEVQPFYTTSPVISFNIAETAAYTCAADALTLTFDAAEIEGLNFEFDRVK